MELEKALGQLEGDANTVISKIITTERIDGLSDAEKEMIYAFIALQYARTPEFRNQQHDHIQNFFDKLLEKYGVMDYGIRQKKEHAGRIHFAHMLYFVTHAGPYFQQMEGCLLMNDTDMPLWTSDNPVIRHNDLTGKLGIGSPGIQFFLPLTPNLLFWLYDRTYIDILADVDYNAGVSEKHPASACNNIPKTLPMEKANVIHHNYLQTKLSTRFIFSNTPRFRMMKAFLDANGDYKMQRVIKYGRMANQWQDGSVTKGDGWECRDSWVIEGVRGLLDNLQNALWHYRDAVRDPGICSKFAGIYDSLEEATNICGAGDTEGDEFIHNVRNLVGDPKIPVNELRILYNRIMSNKRQDLHIDMVDVAKQVEYLQRIARTAMLRRSVELLGILRDQSPQSSIRAMRQWSPWYTITHHGCP